MAERGLEGEELEKALKDDARRREAQVTKPDSPKALEAQPMTPAQAVLRDSLQKMFRDELVAQEERQREHEAKTQAEHDARAAEAAAKRKAELREHMRASFAAQQLGVLMEVHLSNSELEVPADLLKAVSRADLCAAAVAMADKLLAELGQ